MIMRLQKALAEAGVASRRAAEKLITDGRVNVNGKLVRELGTKVDPAKDHIEVNQKPIAVEKKVYIKLYKPVGYVSSVSSQEGQSVLRLIDAPERVYPVGRLDKRSEGLMILTNDGDYALKTMHPRYEHEKEYVVDLDMPLSPLQKSKIERGPIVDGILYLPMKVQFTDETGKQVRMTLQEGKNRQIRRVFEHLGYRVKRLVRVRIGKLHLGKMEPGEWSYFKP